jgi:hypothetical protein
MPPRSIRDYIDDNVDQPAFNAVSDYVAEPIYNAFNGASDYFTGNDTPPVDLSYDDFRRGMEEIQANPIRSAGPLARSVIHDPIAQTIAAEFAGPILQGGKALLGVGGKGVAGAAELLGKAWSKTPRGTVAGLGVAGLSAADKLKKKKGEKSAAVQEANAEIPAGAAEQQGPGELRGPGEMQGPDARRPGIDRLLTRQDIMDAVQNDLPITLHGNMIESNDGHDKLGDPEYHGGTFSRPASKEAVYEKILSAKERIEAQKAAIDAVKETTALRSTIQGHLQKAKTAEEQVQVLRSFGIDASNHVVPNKTGKGSTLDWNSKDERTGLTLSDRYEGFFHNHAKDQMGGYYNFPTGRSHSGQVSPRDLASEAIAKAAAEAKAAKDQESGSEAGWSLGGSLTAMGLGGLGLYAARKQIMGKAASMLGKGIEAVAPEAEAGIGKVAQKLLGYNPLEATTAETAAAMSASEKIGAKRAAVEAERLARAGKKAGPMNPLSGDAIEMPNLSASTGESLLAEKQQVLREMQAEATKRAARAASAPESGAELVTEGSKKGGGLIDKLLDAPRDGGKSLRQLIAENPEVAEKLRKSSLSRKEQLKEFQKIMKNKPDLAKGFSDSMKKKP